MKVLSIDVGIKNLSFCLFDVFDKNINILIWENVNVTEEKCNKLSFETLVEQMLLVLQYNFDSSFSAEVVLIENQPMLKNGLMKSMAVVIYSYFSMLKIQFGNIENVKFTSASNKLKFKFLNESNSKLSGMCDVTKTYKDRKKTAIHMTTEYLQQIGSNKCEWFMQQRKKDDLSDAFLQGMFFIQKHIIHS